MEATLRVPKAVDQRSLGEKLLFWGSRLVVLCAGVLALIPYVNPGRISSLISPDVSLLTTAVSYETITVKLQALFINKGMISASGIHQLMLSSALVLLGIVIAGVGVCMTLGNVRMKKRGSWVGAAGGAVMIVGCLLISRVASAISSGIEAAGSARQLRQFQALTPSGIQVFLWLGILTALLCLGCFALYAGKASEPRMEMEEKYRLFLMMLPVLLLAFVFCYLPVFGWRFAFFDYRVGEELTADKFVGFQWFRTLFANAGMRSKISQVLINTLAMSGLGILTSWLPIAFAVLLAEVRSTKFQRTVQTLTTIPNFISWVLVYAIALAIFSPEGFINGFARNVLGVPNANTDYLASADHTWIKMLLWGTWKGVGWSAIVYIAGIAGIDQQLYEAAKVDGANRFACIWHITIPGLLPTYMVMLLMSIAGILSNGMEQYLVFKNPQNATVIEVLDLYVYNLGIIGDNNVPISTVIGIAKSLVGIVLLFGANGISKAIRGESII